MLIWPLKRVHQAERMPRGYGVAWIEWERASCIAAPLVFNVIISFVNRVLMFLIKPSWVTFSIKDMVRLRDENRRLKREVSVLKHQLSEAKHG